LLSYRLAFVSAEALNVILRIAFFTLNLASNAVMWALFTRALTAHPSTTRVSVVNTSANFALTAVLGMLVFQESIGGIGGVIGLGLLVGGCVVLGRETGEGGHGARMGSEDEGQIEGQTAANNRENPALEENDPKDEQDDDVGEFSEDNEDTPREEDPLLNGKGKEGAEGAHRSYGTRSVNGVKGAISNFESDDDDDGSKKA
jgi:hypothetical protein